MPASTRIRSKGTTFLAGTGPGAAGGRYGPGKTLQAIGAAVGFRENEGRGRSSSSARRLSTSGQREIAEIHRPGSQSSRAAPPERGVQYRRDTAFHIINYELVLRDLSLINDTLRPDLIIMDEAQRIKNWRHEDRGRGQAHPQPLCLRPFRYPAGEPAEDLYSLMQVVDPRVLGRSGAICLIFMSPTSGVRCSATATCPCCANG